MHGHCQEGAIRVMKIASYLSPGSSGDSFLTRPFSEKEASGGVSPDNIADDPMELDLEEKTITIVVKVIEGRLWYWISQQHESNVPGLRIN